MSEMKKKLLDILLFPARTFERLTNKKATLIAGILLIGAIDLLLPDVMFMIKELFAGKPTADVAYNAVMAVVVLLLLGFVDVIFIGVPLFDIFVYLKKKEMKFIRNTGVINNGREPSGDMDTAMKDPPIAINASPIKVMKIYIMSHFIIIPVTTALYYAGLGNVSDGNPDWLVNIALLLFMIINIWSAAIFSRGINTLFRFNLLFKRLTFIIIFTWNYIFGLVFQTMIVNWLMQLFR